MSLDSQVLFCLWKKKRKTDTRNMLCCAILFCTFPEIQGVGYRKNPVGEGTSALSVRGLEKPLDGIEGKRQGLSYFLSFFFFSPSFWEKALTSLECRSGHGWEGSKWQEYSERTCVLQQNETTVHTSGAWGSWGHAKKMRTCQYVCVLLCFLVHNQHYAYR